MARPCAGPWRDGRAGGHPRRGAGWKRIARRASAPQKGSGVSSSRMTETRTAAFVSGFVSILGRPNVGKSTLLNALIGTKVAIVADKPQTTRTAIQGVLTLTEGQIVFLDTPGFHRAP